MIFGLKRNRKSKRIIRQRWMAEKWSAGMHAGQFSTGGPVTVVVARKMDGPRHGLIPLPHFMRDYYDKHRRN